MKHSMIMSIDRFFSSQRLRYIFLCVAAVLLVTPMMAAAQDPNFGEVAGFITNIRTFINNVLIPLVFAVALLIFIWGMFQYFILGGGDEGSREKGKGLMLWAVIGFVMMVIIWAVVNLFANGLVSGMGTNRGNLDSLPTVSGPSTDVVIDI